MELPAIPMPPAHHFHPSILREYDIRGIFGETLFAADAHAIGVSFGTVVHRTGGHHVVVGRDGRLSSPELEAALVAGLSASGMTVTRIGLAATPMLYFAEASMPQVHAGIQVTGSHNPADHNGFKMVLHGAPYFGGQIAELGALAAGGDWLRESGITPDRPDDIIESDVLPRYVRHLIQALDGIDADRLAALRVGWDAGNGAAGPALELLTSLLPGEHHLLFSEVDGRFPNHHPDPTIEANLADMRALVAAKNLDFGLAFDGDADRLGVIDGRGRVLDADHLMAIFTRDVLARNPGAGVIADVKASRTVFDTVRSLGGVPEMAPSGHSHIKARMKQTGALLGGETSGHFFFADGGLGFDDGLYAAVRLIAIAARTGIPLADMRDAMPETCTTPEIRFALADIRKFAVIDEVRARLAATGARVNALDGVRVDTEDGWWLLRASNTQAALTARAESDTPEGLARLVAQIDAQLTASGVSRG